MLRHTYTSKEKTKKKKANPPVWTGGIGKAFQKNTTPQVLDKSKQDSSGGDFFENPQGLALTMTAKRSAGQPIFATTFCEASNKCCKG